MGHGASDATLFVSIGPFYEVLSPFEAPDRFHCVMEARATLAISRHHNSLLC